MIKEYIQKVSGGVSLTRDEMRQVVSFIAEGQSTDDEISSFLLALSKKRETAQEIAGAAEAMRRYVTPVSVKKDVVLDTCGTGGDGKKTFNISTVAAFVVAGAGITVAKHGNRSVSSSCGSADLLEEMGVNINAPKEVIEKCLAEINIAFLFAPLLHPAMRYVQLVRRNLKIRTIFNLLGPLINPAMPTHQLVGVYEERLVPVIGEALRELGLRHAMVVSGEGGFDEATTTGKTLVCEVKEGHTKEYTLEPEKMGLERARLADITGGDVQVNKQMALNVLKGLEGPHRDIVILNAGACLYLAGRAGTIKEGMAVASESIDSGHAIKTLNKLIEYTNP